jgi:acyl-CoA thioester hydrolase
MKRFEQQIVVQEKHIDDLNHVNNVVYLQWVQDIATAHWVTITDDSIRKKYFWVVLKHELEYFNPAFLHEVLTVVTWVEKSEGVRSERHVEFFNTTSSKTLVRAKTIWCLLDAVTVKPKRIDQDILTLFH